MLRLLSYASESASRGSPSWQRWFQILYVGKVTVGPANREGLRKVQDPGSRAAGRSVGRLAGRPGSPREESSRAPPGSPVRRSLYQRTVFCTPTYTQRRCLPSLASETRQCEGALHHRSGLRAALRAGRGRPQARPRGGGVFAVRLHTRRGRAEGAGRERTRRREGDPDAGAVL